jgi:hypothetical protein
MTEVDQTECGLAEGDSGESWRLTETLGIGLGHTYK